MPRHAQTDALKLRSLIGRLRVVHSGQAPALEELKEELGELLRANCVASLSVVVGVDGLSVPFAAATGESPESFRVLLEQGVRRHTEQVRLDERRFFGPSHRNRVVRYSEILAADEHHDGPACHVPVLACVLGRALRQGVGEQMGVAICDDGALLAYVAAFRPGGFQHRERRLLQSLVGDLRRRLSLERQLRDIQISGGGLKIALEAIPAAAMIVTPTGSIAEANRAARALWTRDPGVVRDAISKGLSALETERFAVHPVMQHGAVSCYLFAERVGPPNVQAAVARAVARWELTPQQTKVLLCLTRGLSNKAIAAELGCAEGTAELHVSALLRKAGCDSRVSLVTQVLLDNGSAAP